MEVHVSLCVGLLWGRRRAGWCPGEVLSLFGSKSESVLGCCGGAAVPAGGQVRHCLCLEVKESLCVGLLWQVPVKSGEDIGVWGLCVGLLSKNTQSLLNQLHCVPRLINQVRATRQNIGVWRPWRPWWCGDFRGDATDSPPKFPTRDARVVFGDDKLWATCWNGG